MKRTLIKGVGCAVVIIAVVLGCNSVLQHIDEEASTGTGGGGQASGSAGAPTGFAGVQSDFVDGPVSPGGTGGVIVDEPELAGEETRSFFTAFQIDPTAEDSAGPKFVRAGDVNQDGLTDLVSAWNQSQPIQLHLQGRDPLGNISFRTVTIAGTAPTAVMAGLEFGQINDDGFLDIVVLVKATGQATLCPPENPGEPPTELTALDGEIIVYFSPGLASLIPDGDSWTEMTLINRLIQDPWIHNQFPGNEAASFEEMKTKPEIGGFTSLAVANIDGVDGDDIVVALNAAKCKTLGQEPPLNTVDFWSNPGPGLSETASAWGAPLDTDPTITVPLTLMADLPQVKDVKIMDIDSDGDLDVIATYTNAISLNIRWVRNPLVPHQTGGPGGLSEVLNGSSDGWRLFQTGWEQRPIGVIDTASDVLAIGDVDGDDFDDIVVRSTIGQIVQWFRRPNVISIQPEFPPNDTVPDRFNFPWPVFTLTEFTDQEPEAISVGDITGDGNVEVLVAAEGAVFWFDGTVGDTVYDPWFGNTIIQDGPRDSTAPTSSGGAQDPAAQDPAQPGGTGVGVEATDASTHINSLLVVDLDGDGRNDIVGTLDRRTDSGLSDDRLVWYRNVQTIVPAAPRPVPVDKQ